jgi:hypothetical protein
MPRGGGFTGGGNTNYLPDANNKKNILTLSKEYFGKATQAAGCVLNLQLILILLILLVALVIVWRKSHGK